MIDALARLLLPAEIVRWPLLLYVLCPPVELIPLHLDQTLYPLLQTTLTLVLFLAAREPGARKALLLVAAGGALIWLSLFISFSLLPGVLLAVAFGATEALSHRDRMQANIRRLMRGVIVAAVVFFVASIALYVLLRYDPFVRFQHAMAHHKQFKTWRASFGVVIEAMALDTLEFVYVVGIPVMGAFVWSLGRPIRRCAKLTASSFDRLAIVTAAVLALLPLTSMTQGEVARLWLFLVPLVVLVAAAGLRALAPRRTFAAFTSVAVLQLAWTMMLKAYSDFY